MADLWRENGAVWTRRIIENACSPIRGWAKVGHGKAAQPVDNSLVDLEPTQREIEQAKSHRSPPEKEHVAKSHSSKVLSPTPVKGAKLTGVSQVVEHQQTCAAMPWRVSHGGADRGSAERKAESVHIQESCIPNTSRGTKTTQEGEIRRQSLQLGHLHGSW